MTAYSRQAETRATTKPEMAPSEQQLSNVTTCPETTTEQETRDCAAQQNPPAAAQITTTGGPATRHRWISSPSLGISTTSTVCTSTDTDTTLDATSSSQDLLSRLPGELRNKIYRYAILQDTSILVDSTGYQRSGLMAVSTQARSETVGIFYSENRFRFDVSEYNSDNLVQFVSRLPVTEQTTNHKTLLWARDSTPNWRNLMIWLQRWHNRELYGWRPPNDVPLGRTQYAKEIALGGLFDIVTRLRDLPWDRVQEMLLEQKPILVNTDKRWGID